MGAGHCFEQCSHAACLFRLITMKHPLKRRPQGHFHRVRSRTDRGSGPKNSTWSFSARVWYCSDVSRADNELDRSAVGVIDDLMIFRICEAKPARMHDLMASRLEQLADVP